MLVEGDKYNPSIVKFLNNFSEHAKGYGLEEVPYLEKLLGSFLASCSALPDDAFYGTTRRFSSMIFEAVFLAVCERSYKGHSLVEHKVHLGSLNELKEDSKFNTASQRHTTDTANVQTRLSRARNLIKMN